MLRSNCTVTIMTQNGAVAIYSHADLETHTWGVSVAEPKATVFIPWHNLMRVTTTP